MLIRSLGRVVLAKPRYAALTAIGVVLATAAIASGVTVALSGSGDSEHMLSLSDGTILVVGSSANGFAPEIECTSADLCEPVRDGANGPRNTERYLLVGSVKPGSENGGVFGFRLTPGAPQPDFVACVKESNGSYGCDRTGKEKPNRGVAIYVHQ
jgi:hypothetical protein